MNTNVLPTALGVQLLVKVNKEPQPRYSEDWHVLFEFSCATGQGKGGLRPEDNFCSILQVTVIHSFLSAIYSSYVLTKCKASNEILIMK